jgi:hypothetical protein
MKVGQINQATAHSIEVKKLAQQEMLKQQQLKNIKERQKELEKMRPQDPDKGQHIDKMV